MEFNMTFSLVEILIHIDSLIIDSMNSSNNKIIEECSFDKFTEHYIDNIYNTYKKGSIVESEIPYGKCEIISCKISTFKEYISNYENEDEISNTKAIIEICFKKLEK